LVQRVLSPVAGPVARQRSTSAEIVSYLIVGVLATSLAAMAAIQLRWALAFLQWPVEVMYGEALIHDHAARLLRGEALYQPIGHPSFSIAAYTPVFYLLMAGAQALFGPSLGPGRIVSIVATVVTAGLLGALAARQGRGFPAGALAALLFVALGFPTPFPWLAIGKEDVLGVGFGIASVLMLAGGTSAKRVAGAAVLAALAILTKQTLIAAFVAGTLVLWFHDRPRAIQFVLMGGGLVAGTGLVLELTTHAFLANTVLANAQPYRLEVLSINLATLKAYQVGPIAVAAFAVLRRLIARASLEDVLLPAYWAATLLPLLGLAVVGSAQNYWIELAAASAVLAAAEIWTWVHSASARSKLLGGALALVPCVNVVVAGRLALIWLPAIGSYERPAEMSAVFDELVQIVRRTPGDVLAEPLDVTALAGKSSIVEPWAADVLDQSGTWDLQPIVDRVCAGDIRLAVLAHPLEEDVVAFNDYAIWPKSMLTAMRRSMVLRERRAGRYLYVPRSGADCTSANN